MRAIPLFLPWFCWQRKLSVPGLKADSDENKRGASNASSPLILRFAGMDMFPIALVHQVLGDGAVANG
jgi:hypothetical protein